MPSEKVLKDSADNVVGLMRTGGRSHVITDASRTLPIPDGFHSERCQCQTYITAHHMLHHLNLKPTDAVLIHGGGEGRNCSTPAKSMGGAPTYGQLLLQEKRRSFNPWCNSTDRHNEDFVENVRSQTNGRKRPYPRSDWWTSSQTQSFCSCPGRCAVHLWNVIRRSILKAVS